MPDVPTVVEAWSAVMDDVQAIRKDERNKAQGFNFRGIDTVVNAVGPVLRKRRVVVVPEPKDIKTTTYQTSGGTTMHSAIVNMRYTVVGPAGDVIIGGAYGEAADAGDKAVSKAQSVAYRVFLLQGLTIPTDEPDPDAEAHQRAVPAPVNPLYEELRQNAAILTAAQRTELRNWRVKTKMPEPSQMSDDELKAALRYIDERAWLT